MFKTTAFTAALATVATVAFAPTTAVAGPITTLGECYDAVITWCNETYPEHSCEHPSGLDDCDEVFGDKSQGGNFKMTLGQGPTERILKLRAKRPGGMENALKEDKRGPRRGAVRILR